MFLADRSHFGDFDVDHQYEMELKRCDLPTLLTLLGEIETRLGTAQERSTDFVRAQAIAHRINNVYTVANLLAALRSLPRNQQNSEPSPPLGEPT